MNLEELKREHLLKVVKDLNLRGCSKMNRKNIIKHIRKEIHKQFTIKGGGATFSRVRDAILGANILRVQQTDIEGVESEFVHRIILNNDLTVENESPQRRFLFKLGADVPNVALNLPYRIHITCHDIAGRENAQATFYLENSHDYVYLCDELIKNGRVQASRRGKVENVIEQNELPEVPYTIAQYRLYSRGKPNWAYLPTNDEMKDWKHEWSRLHSGVQYVPQPFSVDGRRRRRAREEEERQADLMQREADRRKAEDDERRARALRLRPVAAPPPMPMPLTPTGAPPPGHRGGMG